MVSTLVKKVGLKRRMRGALVRAPEAVGETLERAGASLSRRVAGAFDWIFVCVKDQGQLEREFVRLKKRLRSTGMLWISWRKKIRADAGLTVGDIIRAGYDQGLVESKCVSVNGEWSAIKFTFPKERKVYRNSFGRLRRPV